MGKIGIVFTVFWLLMVAVIIGLKFDSFSTLKLNEWGDFLAGITAPMAFFWLIIGYLLQKKELENNTQALRLQVEEMAESAENHRESVALQKIELAHQYTMSLDLKDINLDNAEKGLMGVTVINNGRERHQFCIRTVPDVGIYSPIKSSVFQANEGRRYYWLAQSKSTPVNKFVVEISYTDIENLHQGKSYFTVTKVSSEMQYDITRGKYS
ncbi:hypothetical protein KW482_03545 [Vibrio fluvialis]|nr:hypothetical protein [Vibrio fluvialis]